MAGCPLSRLCGLACRGGFHRPQPGIGVRARYHPLHLARDDFIAVWRNVTEIYEINFIAIKDVAQIYPDATLPHLRAYQWVNRPKLAAKILVQSKMGNG